MADDREREIQLTEMLIGDYGARHPRLNITGTYSPYRYVLTPVCDLRRSNNELYMWDMFCDVLTTVYRAHLTRYGIAPGNEAIITHDMAIGEMRRPVNRMWIFVRGQLSDWDWDTVQEFQNLCRLYQQITLPDRLVTHMRWLLYTEAIVVRVPEIYKINNSLFRQ